MLRSPLNGSRGPRFVTTLQDWDYHRPILSGYLVPYEDTPGVDSTDPLVQADWTDDEMFDRILRLANERMTRGDVPLNMSSTSLVTNAYIHTGDNKYKQWVLEYLQAWFESLEATGGPDRVICVCEEVTSGDIPAMIERGPSHPDHIKRVTRAGMGVCQGRRCREQLQMLIAQATDVPVDRVPLASYRPPFRPLPLGVIRNQDETPEEREAFAGSWNRRRRRARLAALRASGQSGADASSTQ